MAGLLLSAVTGEITTGTVTKTLLQIIAPAQQRLKVREWSISFNGTSNTATPIKVDVLRQTTAGTMSSLTPVKNNNGDPEAIQSTAQHTSTSPPTSEPTAGDVLKSEEVHPQTGFRLAA